MQVGVQPPTSANNVALPAFAATRRAAAAAERRVSIDRYLLIAGPTAAKSQQQRAADEWDRQTDGHRIVTETPLHILCGQCQ